MIDTKARSRIFVSRKFEIKERIDIKCNWYIRYVRRQENITKKGHWLHTRAVPAFSTFCILNFHSTTFYLVDLITLYCYKDLFTVAKAVVSFFSIYSKTRWFWEQRNYIPAPLGTSIFCISNFIKHCMWWNIHSAIASFGARLAMALPV